MIFRIVQRDDGWHVLSEDESKNLGGPYATKEEAEKRLAEVGAHKAKAASTSSGALHSPTLIGEPRARGMGRAFSVDAPLRLSSEPADCWDQVAKFGRFVKDDGDGPQLAEFNLEHLGQFLDNFSRQVNPLWADTNHDFGDANALYDALALVVDGVPIRTVTRRAENQAAISAPRREQLRSPDTGKAEDGVYAHRYEVTELGQKKLPNVRYVSPLFLTNGQDEQGRDIGYVLLNIAWTNGPFLDGMTPLRMIRLAASPAHGAAPMNPETMKRYGVDDSATPEQMRAAMAKYAEEVDADKKSRDEAMSRYRRFADAVGGEEEMTKFVEKFMKDEESMARFRKFMEGDGDDDDKDDDKREMTAMAKDLGVAASMSAIRQRVTELRFTTAPKTEIADLKRKLGELESKEQVRAQAEKEAEVIAFARKWADGKSPDCAWDPEQVDGLAEFYRSAPNMAKLHVEKNKGRWAALKRYTTAGAPTGKPEGEPLNLAGDDPAEIEKRVDEAAKKIAADEKVSYPVAMTRVKAKHPELYAAYAAMRG